MTEQVTSDQDQDQDYRADYY